MSVTNEVALTAIGNCFDQCGKVITELESHLWAEALTKHGTVPLFSFACYWASGASQKGLVNRPPAVADFEAYLQPEAFDAQVSLNHLRRLVEKVGPWQNLSDSEEPTSDRLLHAIELMGGWVRVCSVMPVEGSVDWAVFAKNFESCWRAAEVRVQRKLNVPLALGLSTLSRDEQKLYLASPEPIEPSLTSPSQ